MQSDNGSYGSASDLLDSHVLGNEKLVEPAMEVSNRSSLDANSVEIGEITESPDTEFMSTSAILHYCKSKILVPYLKLLTLMGLRPLTGASGSSRGAVCCSRAHSALVTALMLLGYTLQYMACFRRDRGFCYQLEPLARASPLEYEAYRRACYGNVTFTYVGPSVLHFGGFLYALYLFRVSDNEQLQNLMERVFLLSAHAPQGTSTHKPRRLLRMLWFFIVVSIVWVSLSLCSVNLMLARGGVVFRWVEDSSRAAAAALRAALVASTLAHDMVQATVITSYCLQAQLLQAHLVFLKERLLARTVTPLNWMREIAEFHKLLRYLNEELAPAVTLFLVVDAAWAAASALRLLALDHAEAPAEPELGAGLLTLLLWVAAVLAPFVQAARLSRECRRTQAVGHELSARPFLHQGAAQEELAALLLYAATLQLRAGLLQCPAAGRGLCLLLALALVVLFTLGMSHYLQ